MRLLALLLALSLCACTAGGLSATPGTQGVANATSFMPPVPSAISPDITAVAAAYDNAPSPSPSPSPTPSTLPDPNP